MKNDAEGHLEHDNEPDSTITPEIDVQSVTLCPFEIQLMTETMLHSQCPSRTSTSCGGRKFILERATESAIHHYWNTGGALLSDEWISQTITSSLLRMVGWSIVTNQENHKT